MEKKTYNTPEHRIEHLICSPLLQDTTKIGQGEGEGTNVAEGNQRNHDSKQDADWGNLW